jgi:hypothetical protein
MVAALAALGLLISGCGGGGGTGNSTSDASAKVDASAVFLKADGPNKLIEFGTEATQAELEAANAVLEKNFDARAAADFAEQCASLSAKAIESVTLIAHVGAAGKVPKGCAGKLKEVATPLAKSKEAREDRLGEPIPVLRVKGNEGFALFHGTDGKDWVIPLEKEGGKWKVGSIREEELKPEAPAKAPKAKGKKTTE